MWACVCVSVCVRACVREWARVLVYVTECVVVGVKILCESLGRRNKEVPCDVMLAAYS